MKSIYLYLIFSCLGILNIEFCRAQDPTFSQFYANKLYLNPAMTGFDDGVNIYSIRRNQWWNIQSGKSKFLSNSLGISFSNANLRSGFGIFYHNNVEGEGQLRWNSFGISYAYVVPFGDTYTTPSGDKKKKRLGVPKGSLRFGINISYDWRDFIWDNFVFVGDLDPRLGIIGVTGMPPAGFEDTGAKYPDVDGGILFTYDIIPKKKVKTNANDSSHTIRNKRQYDKLISIRAGLAAQHLTRPQQSLFSARQYEDLRIPIRWTLHGSVLFNHAFTSTSYSKHRLQFIPSFKIDVQPIGYLANSPFNPFVEKAYYMSVDYGLVVAIDSKRKGATSLYGGLWHRNRSISLDRANTNAIIFLVGAHINPQNQEFRYKIGMSYDYNVTGLGSDTGGAVEVSLTIILPSNSDLSQLFGKSKSCGI